MYLRTGAKTYYVSFYANNKRFLRSTGLTNKEKAEQLCERNLARIGFPMPLEAKEAVFKDFAQDFFDYDTSRYLKRHRNKEEGMGHDWADTCQKRLDKYLIPYWGEYELAKIRPRDINIWLDDLYEKCAPNTVVQIFNNLKTILNEAVRKGKIETNPCLDGVVEKPKKKKGKERSPIDPGLAYDLFHPENTRKLWGDNKICYVANLLSAMTGMRLGEVMGLQVEDIIEGHGRPFLDIKNSYSKKYGLKDTKTHQKRLVPIRPDLLQLLKEIKPESGYVFSLDEGATPIKEGIRRALYRAMDRLGFGKEKRKKWNVVFHSWRYYANTMYLESGMPIAGVQAITGHSTLQMTEHYSRVDGRRFGRQAQQIQERMVDLGA